MSETGEVLDVKESRRIGKTVLSRSTGTVYLDNRSDAQRDISQIDDEFLFISNTMSSVAQGMTGASERERRLAERIANKYRALQRVQE